MLSGLLLLALCLLLPRMAQAAGGNAFLVEAKELFARLEYEKAVRALQAALERPDNTREDVLDIYRLSGICWASMGEEAKAEEAFARLLSIEPGYRFPTARSPRLVAPLERARKRAGKGILVTLEPEAKEGQERDFALRLRIEADPLALCARAVLFHRAAGQAGASKTSYELEPGVVERILRPPVQERAAYHDYHLVVTDRWGGVLLELGSAANAFRMVLEPEMLEAEQQVAWYESWWFWTAVGGVALAGAGATAYFLWPRPPDRVDFELSTR
ncbi:MAG: hypothetical protein JXR96_14170 [Deltaproteobacteria bacterium]|nr:hypothetical protein [Deltaproteobacteria bacterium]